MASLLPPVFGRRRTKIAPEPPTGGESAAPLCSPAWAIAALVLVVAVVLFYRLGAYRTLGTHETIAVVPAREMIQSGDWVFPTFGGLPRLRKPPLIYWMIAGSASIWRELSPFTARLPSALAGLLLSCLMGLWAKRWYGSSVGWAAVFVQLTSVWFVIFARKAEIDMLLCLFTTTALFLIADEPNEERRGRSFWRWLAVYLLLSLAWLGKFHYGPAMILAPAIVYFLVERRWEQFRGFLHPVGLACFAAAVTIWPMLVLKQAPGAWEIWKRETWGRALGEMGGHPLYFYLPFLIWLPMPWTPFALAMLRKSWQAAWRDRDPRERFLWIWIIAQFAILTLSVSKHKHYLLAMLPMLTLLAARGISALFQGFHQGRLTIPRPWLVTAIGLDLAVCIGTTYHLQQRWPAMSEVFFYFGLSLCCCHAAGWWLLSRRRVMGVLAVNVLCLLIGGAMLADWIVPHCDRRVNVLAFAHEIRSNMLPEESVCVYRMDREPLVFHLGEDVYRAESLVDLKPKLTEPEPIYVVGYEHFVNELAAVAETVSIARLPKGPRDLEPIEGDLVLVKVFPRRIASKPILPARANAN